MSIDRRAAIVVWVLAQQAGRFQRGPVWQATARGACSSVVEPSSLGGRCASCARPSSRDVWSTQCSIILRRLLLASRASQPGLVGSAACHATRAGRAHARAARKGNGGNLRARAGCSSAVIALIMAHKRPEGTAQAIGAAIPPRCMSLVRAKSQRPAKLSVGRPWGGSRGRRRASAASTCPAGRSRCPSGPLTRAHGPRGSRGTRPTRQDQAVSLERRATGAERRSTCAPPIRRESWGTCPMCGGLEDISARSSPTARVRSGRKDAGAETSWGCPSTLAATSWCVGGLTVERVEMWSPNTPRG